MKVIIYASVIVITEIVINEIVYRYILTEGLRSAKTRPRQIDIYLFIHKES